MQECFAAEVFGVIECSKRQGRRIGVLANVKHELGEFRFQNQLGELRFVAERRPALRERLEAPTAGFARVALVNTLACAVGDCTVARVIGAALGLPVARVREQHVSTRADGACGARCARRIPAVERIGAVQARQALACATAAERLAA